MERRNAWLSYTEAEEKELEQVAKAYRNFLKMCIRDRSNTDENTGKRTDHLQCGSGDQYGCSLYPVSYTHLDVYKRQTVGFPMIVNLFMHQKLKKIDIVE